MERLIAEWIQPNGVRGLRRRQAIEEQQHDLGGGLREQREVDATGIGLRENAIAIPVQRPSRDVFTAAIPSERNGS